MNKEFSFSNYSDDFDNHIQKSIRGYGDLVKDVVDISSFCIDSYSNVIDIGCSTGSLLKKIVNKNKDTKVEVTYTGIEIEPSFEKYFVKEKPLNWIVGDVYEQDLTNCSFIYSLFTLQFLPLNRRYEIFEKIFNSLNSGGVFLFTEKVDMSSSRTNEILQNLGVEYKRNNFSDSEILDKEINLRSLMRRVSLTDNINLCKKVGFKKVDTFWQNQRFVGYLAIKDF